MKAKQEIKKSKQDHKDILDDAKVENDNQSEYDGKIDSTQHNINRRTIIFESRKSNAMNRINLEKLKESENSEEEEEEESEVEKESPKESKNIDVYIFRRYI